MTCVFMEENEIIQLNSVDQYNQMFGLETLHPPTQFRRPI